jgi:ribosome maturation factor RimP
MMRPELSNWRVQGPTLGRIGLNAMVHEWALTNGGINAQLLADKAVVDRVTLEACSDVHDEAVRALELPDLASGLAF